MRHNQWNDLLGGRALPDPSVADLYASLARDHDQVVERVSKGYYTFWLGSGISRGRAKTIPAFLRGLLDFLAGKLETEADGPHRLALQEILAIARVELTETRRLEDLSQWPDLAEISGTLAEHYSAALDVDVDGQPSDYLLWDGIDVVANYAGPMHPDVEHVSLAMLGAEGAAPILISANWDPLVERAYDLLFGSRTSLLKVEVHPDEFRPPFAQTELVKFHGCATLADSDEDRYRPLIIARKSQISDWITDHSFRALRERLTGIVRDHPSLIAGLSAQDADIQAVFGLAADMNPWAWPTDAGAVVVATPTLGADQKQVLKRAYPANSRDIQADACLGAYPRVVFLALLIHVWRAKLIVELEGIAMTTDLRDALKGGVDAWAIRVSAALMPDDLTELLTPLIAVTQGIARFRRGRAAVRMFEPMTDRAIADSPVEPIRRPGETQLGALSLVIGILASGERDGRWTMDSDGLDVSSADLKLANGVERNLQAFADDGAFAAALVEEELTGPLAIVVASSPFQRRSPRHTFGRTGEFNSEAFYLDEAVAIDGSHGAILDALEGYLAL